MASISQLLWSSWFSALTLAAQQSGSAPLQAPLCEQLPRLAEQSFWGQDVDARQPQPAAARATFVLGNGIVQAQLGLGVHANTLQGVLGPGLDAMAPGQAEGDWGEIDACLLSAGRERALPSQRIRRVRATGLFVTEDAEPGGLCLSTLTGTGQGTSLHRCFEVRNLGAHPSEPLQLRLTWRGSRAVAGSLQKRAARNAAQCARLSVEGGSAFDDTCDCRLGVLAPGARVRIGMIFTTGPDLQVPDAASLRAVFEEQLIAWHERFGLLLQIETDDHRFRDFVADSVVTLLALRDAPSGAVMPAPGCRRAHLLHFTGPLLAFLRVGLWAEARALLDFEFAAVQSGRVEDVVPLDSIAAVGQRAVDWNTLAVPANALGPWLVLHHYWYLRTTQDAAPIRAHWPLLEACVKRVPRREQVLLQADAEVPWGGTGGQWSFASSATFVQAVASIGGMLDLLDRQEHPERWSEGTPALHPGAPWQARWQQLLGEVEQRFWQEDAGRFATGLELLDGAAVIAPDAEAGLVPAWLGMLITTGDRTPRHVRSTLRGLWRAGAKVGASATAEPATALAQVLTVAALTQFDVRERRQALAALLDLVTPSGCLRLPLLPAGEPCSALATGAAVDAALYAVTGCRTTSSPHVDEEWRRWKLLLPPDATHLALRGLAHAGFRGHLFVDERCGALATGERELLATAMPLEPAADQRRLHFVLTQESRAPGQGQALCLVRCAGAELQAWLRPGEPLERVVFETVEPESWLSRSNTGK